MASKRKLTTIECSAYHESFKANKSRNRPKKNHQNNQSASMIFFFIILFLPFDFETSAVQNHALFWLFAYASFFRCVCVLSLVWSNQYIADWITQYTIHFSDDIRCSLSMGSIRPNNTRIHIFPVTHVAKVKLLGWWLVAGRHRTPSKSNNIYVYLRGF